MPPIYVPTRGVGCWQALLAKPDRHWRTGFSARALAHAWEEANGLPTEVAALFGADAELLLALPEHKVPLPGGSRESQSDVFALVRAGGKVSAVAVEGKVEEPFGPTLGEWMAEPTSGKQERLRYVCAQLGLSEPARDVRYQLLHRTASAVVEAKRFGAAEAAMVVHSFSPTRTWFQDYATFALLFGIQAEPERAVVVRLPTGLPLRLGWVTGAPEFLSR